MGRLLLLSLILFVLIVDQGTKQLARTHLARRRPHRYGAITFLYAENQGAFLDLGSTLPPQVRAILFDGVVAIGLLVAAVVLFRGPMQSQADAVAVALIIGGGVGNLIDRLRFEGRVSDFLYLAAGPLHTGIFNAADLAITFGVIWLMASWMFTGRRRATPLPR